MLLEKYNYHSKGIRLPGVYYFLLCYEQLQLAALVVRLCDIIILKQYILSSFYSLYLVRRLTLDPLWAGLANASSPLFFRS